MFERERVKLTLPLSPFYFSWQGYYFHTDNPYKDLPNAFEEGLKKSREGELPNAVLLLEAAVLQDPHDSEVKSPNTHTHTRRLFLIQPSQVDNEDVHLQLGANFRKGWSTAHIYSTDGFESCSDAPVNQAEASKFSVQS